MGKKAVVAGHICIDITPIIPEHSSCKIQDIFMPGGLINVGDADIHTGGAVANTGLAMKFLGADVTLVGKTGDDAFADMIRSVMLKYDAADGLIRSRGDSTSYSVVLAVPGVDRIFLHNPGANDTFCADDLPLDAVREASLFHFGYPPIMKRMYENDGEELVKIMRLVKEAGPATSLDLAAVDEKTEAGAADWEQILKKTLPYVDIFAPSVEELMFMIEREKYDRISKERGDRDFTELIDIGKDIEPLGRRCLDMGAGIVIIKCGARGLFYCTGNVSSLKSMSGSLSLDINRWADKRGFEKSFKPDKVLSATGAGDTCVAAFLTSILKGYDLKRCVRYASAAGACCVEAYDALSGLKTFKEMDKKMDLGWEKNP